GRFLESPLVEQACLGGHGLAQTVMMAVLSAAAQGLSDAELDAELRAWVQSINARLEKHERIGAVILSRTPWSQDNGVLTHTLKIKRDAVDERYSEELERAGDRMRTGEPLFVVTVE
ncbi:MAG: hypothetical protein V2J89_07775, partial [Halieaceae bacterium]|nr:hypothetical protein [Halieaceae bacterium]